MKKRFSKFHRSLKTLMPIMTLLTVILCSTNIAVLSYVKIQLDDTNKRINKVDQKIKDMAGGNRYMISHPYSLEDVINEVKEAENKLRELIIYYPR